LLTIFGTLSICSELAELWRFSAKLAADFFFEDLGLEMSVHLEEDVVRESDLHFLGYSFQV